MPLEPVPPVDTRALFRPVSASLVRLLRGLPLQDWQKPTIAGTWLVRDVVAHLVDLTVRRLSFHRDGMIPPPPPRPINSDRDFVAFINELNADWVKAAQRISATVLTKLYAVAGSDLADFFESCPLDAPPLFPVSWAGDDGNLGWLDIGREFTEQWHHQMQVRDAVGARPLFDPAWLRAVLLIAVRGLPHAYRETPSAPENSIVIEIVGDSGGTFTLEYDGRRWRILSGEDIGAEQARAVMSADTAWRLLFNALTPEQREANIEVQGNTALLKPLFEARSVVV